MSGGSDHHKISAVTSQYKRRKVAVLQVEFESIIPLLKWCHSKCVLNLMALGIDCDVFCQGLIRTLRMKISNSVAEDKQGFSFHSGISAFESYCACALTRLGGVSFPEIHSRDWRTHWRLG